MTIKNEYRDWCDHDPGVVICLAYLKMKGVENE